MLPQPSCSSFFSCKRFPRNSWRQDDHCWKRMFVPISKAWNTASMRTRVNIIFLFIMGKDDWRSKTLKWIKARRSIRQILETTWSHRQCMPVSSIPATENEIQKWPIQIPATADMLSLCRWTTILLSHYPSADLDTILSLFEMIKVPFYISLFRSLCEDRLRFLFCCFILCTMYQTKNHVDYYAVAKEGGPKCSPNRK